ncbi:hypothetical protein HYV86_01015 [Candidatus Woesearchaeota archaeon]|nr:hypothetical protein [Candidatus Woesearchaeota archaeon]
MNTPQELVEELANDPLYLKWVKNNPKAFLSHFFSPIDSLLQQKDGWEVGYYEPLTDRITVFKALDKGGFEIRAPAEVFKQPNSTVEQLDLKEVQCSFDDACTVARVQFSSLYPKEKCGDGFVILQHTDQLPLWNFNLISHSLKFLNVKLNAQTSQLASHQAVELVQK